MWLRTNLPLTPNNVHTLNNLADAPGGMRYEAPVSKVTGRISVKAHLSCFVPLSHWYQTWVEVITYAVTSTSYTHYSSCPQYTVRLFLPDNLLVQTAFYKFSTGLLPQRKLDRFPWCQISRKFHKITGRLPLFHPVHQKSGTLNNLDINSDKISEYSSRKHTSVESGDLFIQPNLVTSDNSEPWLRRAQ